MLTRSQFVVTIGVLSGIAAIASAQSQFIINDRTSDALHLATDANGDGKIDDATETSVFFDAGNAAGTLPVGNPTSLAISDRGVVIFGDQGNRVVYRLDSANCDGDAQDAGESIVFADATNAAGVSFAFPTGVTFGPDGGIYVVNAGNAFGDDGIYRLEDLNGDGDAQDEGEITTYVGEGAFGPDNGSFSPQEIFFDADGVGYLRNSGAAGNGVWRFEDINGNGRADDHGEFTVFWDSVNAEGTPAGVGFGLEPDPTQARTMYALQLASGGVDQLVRLQDVNGDGDAQDAGESSLVWETDEDDFSSVDLTVSDSGDVLITDNPRKVIRLSDANGDGDFLDEGERLEFLPNAGGTLQALRQISPVRLRGDLTYDGAVNVFDLLDLLGGWGQCNSLPCRADLTGDGTVNVFDLLELLGEWGACF